MEEIILDYKHDAYGNPIKAHVFHPTERSQAALPIGMVRVPSPSELTLTLF